MVVLYELLWYKIHSLKDLLLYKKGKLKMTMPTEVSQTVIERKNNIPNIYYEDAPIRSRAKSKSWKDCTKKKKQYM